MYRPVVGTGLISLTYLNYQKHFNAPIPVFEITYKPDSFKLVLQNRGNQILKVTKFDLGVTTGDFKDITGLYNPPEYIPSNCGLEVINVKLDSNFVKLIEKDEYKFLLNYNTMFGEYKSETVIKNNNVVITKTIEPNWTETLIKFITIN